MFDVQTCSSGGTGYQPVPAGNLPAGQKVRVHPCESVVKKFALILGNYSYFSTPGGDEDKLHSAASLPANSSHSQRKNRNPIQGNASVFRYPPGLPAPGASGHEPSASQTLVPAALLPTQNSKFETQNYRNLPLKIRESDQKHSHHKMNKKAPPTLSYFMSQLTALPFARASSISSSQMEEKLELRVYGDAGLPTLIYLPGMHGDWTLIGGFRSAVAGRVRFVEMTYPRTVTWSLEDHAFAIEAALAEKGIERGWLLGESFGSQPMWAIIGRGKFSAQGAILAGGFVRYPLQWMMRLMEKTIGFIPSYLLVKIIFGYAKFARIRYRKSPETLATLDEFLARRRSEEDRRAAQHRIHLVARSDLRAIARSTKVPVFGIAGILDPLVPWPPVRRWLKGNCPALRDYKIIRRADHNVLNTGTKDAARQILSWINSTKNGQLKFDDGMQN
jgi:pimeloyl-ACP methyl ester carboxylesterase